MEDTMNTREVTQANLEATVKDGIVLLDWWASWCGPCRAFAPVFEAVAAANPDAVFGKVNTEVEQELAEAFQIQAIPTLMAFRDGILVYASPGALSAPQLAELVEKVRGLDMVEVRKEVDAAEARERAGAESVDGADSKES